jgi:hypothetical protein
MRAFGVLIGTADIAPAGISTSVEMGEIAIDFFEARF